VNPFSPPYLGATDPEGRETNFAWDVHPNRMNASVNLQPFADTIHDQGPGSTCVGRGVSGAIDTFCNIRGVDMDSSWSAIYSGGWQEQHGTRVPPDGSAGLESSLVALQWLNRKGLLTDSEWPETSGVTFLTDEALALCANRTVDFAELMIGDSIVNSVRAALQLGMPVVFDMNLTYSFSAISGPLVTHPAQYHYPQRTAPGNPDYWARHCMYVVREIEGVGFVVPNSWSTGFADHGFCCIGYDTFAANAYSAHAITRVDTLVAAPFPETMRALPCPGRGKAPGEPIATQFTLNVRRAMEAIYADPSLTTDQQRAQRILAGMEMFGVTRDEVAFCHPLPRATLDAFLAKATQ
jgi:hypothetical protein